MIQLRASSFDYITGRSSVCSRFPSLGDSFSCSRILIKLSGVQGATYVNSVAGRMFCSNWRLPMSMLSAHRNIHPKTHSHTLVWCVIDNWSFACCHSSATWRRQPGSGGTIPWSYIGVTCVCVCVCACVDSNVCHCLMILLQPTLSLSFLFLYSPSPPTHTHTHTQTHTHTHTHIQTHTFDASANQYVQFWRNTASPWQPGLLSYGGESCKAYSLVSVPPSPLCSVILWVFCIFSSSSFFFLRLDVNDP